MFLNMMDVSSYNTTLSMTTTSSTTDALSLGTAWPTYAYGFGAIIWILCIVCTYLGIHRILREKVFKNRKNMQQQEDGVVGQGIVLMCFAWVVIFLITVVSSACSGINSEASEWNLQWQSLLACHALPGLQ